MTVSQHVDQVDLLITLASNLASRWQSSTDQQAEFNGHIGDWSTNEVLAHVAEFLPYWAEQAAAVAASCDPDRPFGRTHDDPARAQAVAVGGVQPLNVLARDVVQAAAAAKATLLAIPDGSWSREGMHASRGRMSVYQLVDSFILDHLREHVAQAEAAHGHRPEPKESDAETAG